MKYKKVIYTLILILCFSLFLFSGHIIFSYFVESWLQEAKFDKLKDLVSEAEASSNTESINSNLKTSDMLPGYAALYEKNQNLFGWVQIEGTKLNYPVMYTPDSPEYYLRRNFDGSHSASGVPFLDEDYKEDGNNYLIYGHSMNSGTMFATLLSYSNQEFYEDHPIILFDTLYERGKYEVIAAFYSKVYDANDTNVFRYYEYSDLSDPKKFREYVKQVKAAALYDTGISAGYGDQLLTLSTCSYHINNGRFVVVARKKT